MTPKLSRLIEELINKNNYPYAEIILREQLEAYNNDHEAIYMLGVIAIKLNLPEYALEYFREATKLTPDSKPARNAFNYALGCVNKKYSSTSSNLETSDRYLLIKAWGCGFWSDISHVLAQLLLAELTQRIPVIHWGDNSLYSDDESLNAFDNYFSQPSNETIDDLIRIDNEFWPPKWNKENLYHNNINKWSGPYSRIAGLYLLGRCEKTIVSDFYTSVFDLRPWIPEDSMLYGLSVDELWRYLCRKYLSPKNEIIKLVDDFYEQFLKNKRVLAIHLRGSDKFGEYRGTDMIEQTRNEFDTVIDQYLSTKSYDRIFLMTDDDSLLNQYKKSFGDILISTDCTRSKNSTGVHKSNCNNKSDLGIEIMRDVYLALRADAFVGTGMSNPSRFIYYLKDWPNNTIHLQGPNVFYRYNHYLHEW